MTNLSDRLATIGAEAEDAEAMNDPRDPLPDSVTVTRGHNRSRTLQVRLNEDEHDELERLAKSEGLPVSTVARSLIFAALGPVHDPSATIARIETELASLKRAVSQG